MRIFSANNGNLAEDPDRVSSTPGGFVSLNMPTVAPQASPFGGAPLVGPFAPSPVIGSQITTPDQGRAAILGGPQNVQHGGGTFRRGVR